MKESTLDSEALVTLVSLKTSDLSLKNRNAVGVGEVFVIQDLGVRRVDGGRRLVARLVLSGSLATREMSRAMEQATFALVHAGREVIHVSRGAGGAGAPTTRSSSGKDLRVARCGALFDFGDRRAPDGRKVDLDIRGVIRMLKFELGLELDRGGMQRPIRG